MRATTMGESRETGFKLTGGIVLFALVSFFAVVIVVNGIMAYLAVETFSGVQSEKPYENGLAFNRDIARARTQETQGWMVDEAIARSATGDVSIEVSVKEPPNKAVKGLTLNTTLKAPVDSRLDCKVGLKEQSDGIYTGITQCAAGQWDVETVARQDGNIVYQSINRIILH